MKSNKGQNMFIKYKCGCLAIRDSGTEEMIILQRCDRSYDENDYTFSEFHDKDLKGRSFEEIRHVDKTILIADLRCLISQGYRYREIKNLLKD